MSILPSRFRTSSNIAKVEFDPGCEAMIYTVDGVPLQGTNIDPGLVGIPEQYFQALLVVSEVTVALNTLFLKKPGSNVTMSSLSNLAAMACSVYLGMGILFNLQM